MPPSWSTWLPAPAPPPSVAATIRRPQRALPVIGDGTQPDAERVTAVRPDLIIAWQPAAAEPLVRVMDKLGVPVYYSDPQTLADIPAAVERMGELFGTQDQARPPPAARMAGRLAARHADRRPLRVFIQAGLDPIYTLNRTSIVSDALRLCGGVNVFADSPVVAPQVSLESVLAARPRRRAGGRVAAGRQGEQPRGLAQAGLRPPRPAMYGIDADALYRPGPA